MVLWQPTDVILDTFSGETIPGRFCHVYTNIKYSSFNLTHIHKVYFLLGKISYLNIKWGCLVNLNLNCVLGFVASTEVGLALLHLVTPSLAAPHQPWTATPSWRWSMGPPLGSQSSHTTVFQDTRTKVTFLPQFQFNHF